MKNSTDLTLIIMFAVLNFVFMALIGQVPRLITGIGGIGYAFTIFYSITITVALLLYEGRRWRIFTQGLLFTLLSILVTPANVIAWILSSILLIFIFDVVFNSVYGFFEKKNKLVWWAIIGQVCYWTASPFMLFLALSIFFPWQGVLTTWFIPIMSVFLPVMIIEAIAGGYIGYKIYGRVEKIA